MSYTVYDDKTIVYTVKISLSLSKYINQDNNVLHQNVFNFKLITREKLY